MSAAADTRSSAASGQLVDGPRQSFLPLAMGFGVTVLLVGLLASRPALAFGALMVLVTAIVWIARLVGDLR